VLASIANAVLSLVQVCLSPFDFIPYFCTKLQQKTFKQKVCDDIGREKAGIYRIREFPEAIFNE
jgi:hypothetical protein